MKILEKVKIQHKDTQLYLADNRLENSGASGNQVWEMIDGGKGDFFLKNTGTNKYLAALSGHVVLGSFFDKSVNSLQRWKKSGVRIENVKSNKCLANKSSLNVDNCSLKVTYEDWNIIDA